jgi:hypothetical protein
MDSLCLRLTTLGISAFVDGQEKDLRSSYIDDNVDQRLPLRVMLFDPVAREEVRFRKLAKEIETIIGSDRWVKCSPQCMRLLRHGGPFDQRGPDGSTPLLRAIEANNDPSKISVGYDTATLIEAGSDPSISDLQGFTPLMAAARNGDANLVRDLLAHGASSNARDKEGRTANDYAKSPEIRALLGPTNLQQSW